MACGIALASGVAAALCSAAFAGVASLSGDLGARERDGAIVLAILAAIMACAALVTVRRGSRERSEPEARLPNPRRLVVVEENVPDYSVGASIIAGVAQRLSQPFVCRAVGARAVPLPSARHLEDKVLPSAEAVVAAVAALCA